MVCILEGLLSSNGIKIPPCFLNLNVTAEIYEASRMNTIFLEICLFCEKKDYLPNFNIIKININFIIININSININNII